MQSQEFDSGLVSNRETQHCQPLLSKKISTAMLLEYIFFKLTLKFTFWCILGD